MLQITGRFDRACAALADCHYSRRKHGSPQFSPPGELLVLRDREGLIVLSFVKQRFRLDRQRGIYCSIFRNESSCLSSDILQEAEVFIRARWKENRVFTLIDPKKIKSPNPGYCFKKAGWIFKGINVSGQHVLARYL